MAPGEIPSNNLWVSNLAPNVTATVLMPLFQSYGPLDRVIAYSSNGFGFIRFRNINDSTKAKHDLQGFFFHGMPLKIKFSMPEQGQEFSKIRDEQHPDRRIDRPDHPQLMHQDFVENYSDPIHAGFTRQHEQGSKFREMRHGHYSNRGIVRPNPGLVPHDFVRNDSHPMNVDFTRHEKESEFQDGHHPQRSIVHPDPRLMPRNFVRNYSHPMNADFTRQHVMQGKLFNDLRIAIEYSNNENPFQPAQTIGHNRPMLTSNVFGCLPPYGPDIPARPLSMQGTFRPVQLQDTSPHNVMGDPSWKQASPTPRVLSSPSDEQKPPSIFVVPGWDVFHSSQLLRETKRSMIDGENNTSYPQKKISDQGYVLDEQYGLGPFGSDVPSGPVIISRANNSDAIISPGQHHYGHDFIWRGIIAKNGTSVCRAICVPVGESIKCEIPDAVNCYARTRLDKLAKHYVEAAVGFSIVSFFPDTETDHASYGSF